MGDFRVPLILMSIKQTTSKITAIKAYINTWLKDQTVYCANCGEDWNAAFHVHESCCECPQFGRNADHTRAVIKQNKDIADTRLKDTGATENNSLRIAASIPPRLLRGLEDYFKKHGDKFLETPKELHAFLKEFPAFKTCKKV